MVLTLKDAHHFLPNQLISLVVDLRSSQNPTLVKKIATTMKILSLVSFEISLKFGTSRF